MEQPSIRDEQRAKRRWILRGMFGWGILCFVLSTAWRYYDDHQLFSHGVVGFLGLAASLAIWIAMGYVWGLWMWHFGKRRRNQS